jgi:hypothetical protein
MYPKKVIFSVFFQRKRCEHTICKAKHSSASPNKVWGRFLAAGGGRERKI